MIAVLKVMAGEVVVVVDGPRADVVEVVVVERGGGSYERRFSSRDHSS